MRNEVTKLIKIWHKSYAKYVTFSILFYNYSNLESGKLLFSYNVLTKIHNAFFCEIFNIFLYN
jgi:hypothetical protein